MKRLKLTRKEMLLYATPLLLPLLVLAWPLVSANSFKRTLWELAGPQAVDCGLSSDLTLGDPCSVATLKAGKPFVVRYNIQLTDPADLGACGLAGTLQGQFYWVTHSPGHLTTKASLSQTLHSSAKIDNNGTGRPHIVLSSVSDKSTIKTRVWW